MSCSAFLTLGQWSSGFGQLAPALAQGRMLRSWMPVSGNPVLKEHELRSSYGL